MFTPYFSQWRHVSDEAWQGRACGVASAAMALCALGVEATPDELLLETQAMTGHLAWTKDGMPHAAICALFRNRGLHSYHEEYRGRRYDPLLGEWRDDLALDAAHLEYGLAKIREALGRGEPVIASVAAGFRTNREGHLIVLTAIAEGGFTANDPDDRSGEGEQVFVPERYFGSYFRRFAIFGARA